MTLLLGAIADDFTGATDLCNTLVKQGMRAVQVIGVPREPIDTGDADAVVVALKTRSIAPDEAVAASLDALRWLRERGARQFFFKYCSTFDSTAEGNIGPVADALLDALGADFAPVCPAFPATGRTVYQGHLFVGESLLADSPMKDHPLTPMRDSNLRRLMSAQSRRRVGLVDHATVSSGADAVALAFDDLARGGFGYGVVDAVCDGDLLTIGEAAADQALVTGGSGIALGLPGNYRRRGLLGDPAPARLPRVEGREVVLAGSCSAATRRQLDHVRDRWPCIQLDALGTVENDAVVENAIQRVIDAWEDGPVVVYASADPDEVSRVQAILGRERAGAAVETAIATIAAALVKGGARRLVVAGGETSGAVVSALGVRGLVIGAEIAPGVPWTHTLGDPGVALALKSGNFGGDDFFLRAFDMLP